MSKERRSEIKKKQKIKIIIPVIAVILVLVIGIGTTVASTVHKCDECQNTFYGSGYFKEKEGEGVLGSMFGSLLGGSDKVPLETVEDVVICRGCAMNNISVKTDLRDVEDFKR